MSENAELWCYKGNERTTLEDYLIRHDVKYDKDMTTEELRQLYIRKECGEK